MIQRSCANWVRLVFTCPFLRVLMVLVSSWIGNAVGYIVWSFLVLCCVVGLGLFTF